MKVTKVCHLRDLFLSEWRRDYPSVPSPVLNGIDDLAEDSVIDESVASGHILAVRESLDAVNDKINQLREQIQRELFVKQFLIHVLGVLDEANDVEDQLAEVSRELAGTVGPKPEQRCVGDVNRSCAFNQSKGRPKSQECSSSSVEISPDKVRVHSPKPKVDDSDSGKFISRITVSENKETSNSSDSKLPISHNVTDSVRSSDDHTEDEVYDNSINIKRYLELTDTERADMFGRRKRSNISKPNEGELVPHNLGSKDNFLAVKSKHISPTDIPRHNEGATNSPQLPRNFQLLKLTSGFDIVLGETDTDAEVIDNNNKGSSNGNYDTDSSHASRHTDNTGSENFKTDRVKNRTRGESGDVIHSSGPRENVSTIHIVKPKHHEGKDEHSVESSSEDLNRKSPACDQMAHTHNITASHESLKSSEGETFGNDQGNPIVRQTSGKKGGPPPVPRKPFRPGSGKKLPPIPAGVKPVLRPRETTVGNPEDSGNIHSFDVNKSAGVNRNSSGEIVSDKRRSGEINSARLSVDSHGESERVEIDSLVREKPQSPSTLVSEVRAKYRLSEQQRRLETDSGEVHLQSSLENNLSQRDTTSASESERRITQEPEELYQNMKSYNVAHEKGERKGRGSIGALVEGAVSRMVSVETILIQNTHENEPVSVTPVPHMEEYANMATNGQASADYQRMTSSASTDTIVNDKDRSNSFSSDVEVRDAVYSLDDIISGESTDTMERPSAEKPEPRKRKNSRPDIENWPINRAITASITQQELDSVSDDDELDVISTSSAAASPCLKRQGSSKGSKDSGLCDDLGVPDSPQNDSVFDSEIASGRLRDHKVLHQMESCAEEEDQVDSIEEDSYKDKDMDEICEYS